MILTGDIVVPAPRADVWAVVSTLERLVACLPGGDGVQNADDGVTTWIDRRLGPVSARFHLLLTIDEAVVGERIVVRAEACDREHRTTVRGTSRLILRELAHDATTLEYRHDVTALGPLAAFSQPMVAYEVRRLEAHFRGAILDEIEGHA